MTPEICFKVIKTGQSEDRVEATGSWPQPRLGGGSWESWSPGSLLPVRLLQRCLRVNPLALFSYREDAGKAAGENQMVSRSSASDRDLQKELTGLPVVQQVRLHRSLPLQRA